MEEMIFKYWIDRFESSPLIKNILILVCVGYFLRSLLLYLTWSFITSLVKNWFKAFWESRLRGKVLAIFCIWGCFVLVLSYFQENSVLQIKALMGSGALFLSLQLIRLSSRCFEKGLTFEKWSEIVFWFLLGFISYCALTALLPNACGMMTGGGLFGKVIKKILINAIGLPLYIGTFSICLLLSWFGVKYSLSWLFHAKGKNQQKEKFEKAPESPKKPELPSPWRTLGISVGASRTRIKGAYRQMIQKYHPDRVAAVGTEIRQLAEKKAKEINQAYEELR